MKQRIEWDDAKALKNLKKHGITFQEAATVFDDPLNVTWFDRIENGEQRWKTVGVSSQWKTLIIAHTLVAEDEEGNEVIRIVNARPADRSERERYEHG